MIVKQRTRLVLAVPIAASFAALAFSVAAPPAAPSDTATFSVAGHRFGLGEQQAYLVDRETTLTVAFRDQAGALHHKTFHYHARTSTAWTIESIASNGALVLAVATAAPTPASTASTYGQSIAASSSSPPPRPSPKLDAHGTGRVVAGSALAEIAPLTVLLAGMPLELPLPGQTWKSAGEVRLPYGTLTINAENLVQPALGGDETIVPIASSGTTSFHATVNVPGLGSSSLRGAGDAKALSYLQPQYKVPLGMSLTASSHGNASAQGKNATYDLTMAMTIKLAKYVPGIVPYTGSPGFVPASGYLGETTAPDTQIYSTIPPQSMGIPAPTDTGFIPAPAYATPYRSALPAASLPAIPLPVASDQPIASPPAGPSPTPQPTYPYK